MNSVAQILKTLHNHPGKETALLISLLLVLVHCYISTYGSCKTEKKKTIDILTKVLCLWLFTAGEWKKSRFIISMKCSYCSFPFAPFLKKLKREITFNISFNSYTQMVASFQFLIFTLTKSSWAAIDGETQQLTTL